ncbi:MAG: hypothetical protein NWQ44_09005 [Flavobacteriales bacterium]|nr:hypothetical protein [Flavobacteriales bacterium]MDP4717313.1 hypothetical protein [Flavobacteriales bacterium]MDP4731016.1 hypothetical protein [Flavobacteriales bacterium]MDP4818664.1 hypothetical protein [Flavobacteriales bacterium]MDP4951851.1 hypothetical protein [Flavobacteriales bacterium]
MKKIFLFCASVALVGTMNAQLTNKKGAQILPETGDWAISVKADPFISFASKLVTGFTSGADAGSLTFNQYQEDNTLVFKKFTSNTTADRFIANFGHTSNTSINSVAELDENGAAIADAFVDDKSRVRTTHIGLGYGKEFRKGTSRLQGYYGADAMIYLEGGSTTKSYGNDIVRTQDAARLLKSKQGLTLGVGARGFLGAEYFFAPKMSVGAEFGYGACIYTQGAGNSKNETWNSTDGPGESETNGTSRSLGFSMGFDQEVDSNTPFSHVVGSGVASLKLNLFF